MRKLLRLMSGFLGALIIIILALQTPILSSVRDRTWNSISAVLGNSVGIGTFKVADTVQNELERLRVENIRLNAELFDYQRIKQQIQEPTIDSVRPISGAVLGVGLDPFISRLTVNKGANDGIVLGAPVVTQGTVLIGLITELRDHTSVISLTTHPKVTMSAEIADIEGARGLLQGDAYTGLELTTIPRDVKVESGQSVVTVGSELIPHGLVVGQVENVRNIENEAYQFASLRLPYDPSALRAVVILVQP